MFGSSTDSDLDLIDLAHRVLRVADAVGRQHERLMRTPVTAAQFLLGNVGHGFDLEGVDQCDAALSKAIAKHGAEYSVVAMNERHTLAGLRDLLTGAQELVRPFRLQEAPANDRRRRAG